MTTLADNVSFQMAICQGNDPFRASRIRCNSAPMRLATVLLAFVLIPSAVSAQPAKAKAPTKAGAKAPPEPDPIVIRNLAILADVEKPLPDRVQAAVALGRLRDARARVDLERHLLDAQAAVRAAVVRALGQLGDPSAVPALRAVKNDPEQPVRAAFDEAIDSLGGDPDAPVEWTKVRRAVRLGDLGIAADAVPPPPPTPAGATAAPAPGPATAAPAPATAGPAAASAAPAAATAPAPGTKGLTPTVVRIAVRREVRRLQSTYLLPDGRAPAKVRSEIARRRIETLRLEGSVSKVRYRTNRAGTCVFAEVALLMAGERDRNIRLTLTGSATAGALGHAGRPIDVAALEERAVAEAVRGALRNLEE